MNTLQPFLLLLALLCSMPVTAATSTILGKSESAIACYQMAKQLSTNSETVLTTTEQCDLALVGVLSSKDRASTLVNRGLIYARQGRFDLAFEDYEKAISLNTYIKPIALINLGNAHFLQEDYNAASRYYSEALALGVKQDYAATLNRGMAAEKLGKLKAAEQDYLAALEIKPDWDSALIRLERVRGKLEQ